MTHVALVELGSGCCHYDDSTKAAIRACNDAIEWNSVKVRTIIPGSYDAMRLHVHLGVPDPDSLDLDAISACFPYGTLLPIEVDVGGLRGSSRAGLVADEPPEAHMTVAVACVTVGWGEPTDSDPGEAAQQQEDAASTSDATPSAPSASSASSQSFSPSGSADQIAKLAVAPTVAEMTPGSPELLARAAVSKARWSDRVLTPYEAFKLLGDEDEIDVLDVRTTAQREGHAINGVAGVSVKGARSVALDDLVSGASPLPPAGMPILLVCSKGPKSAVALDYLAEACPRAVCVEGGITAWDDAKLPVEDVPPS